MPSFTVRPLDASSWSAYAELIERNNGVWGGCWCMGFQVECRPVYGSVSEKKEHKRDLVRDGRAHAAVVFDGDKAVGWCQFGRSSEVAPRNKFKKTYFPGLSDEPNWRITCFFVDRKYRGQGVSSLALEGALEMIAASGGGLVEAYPERTEGRNVNGAFVYLGTAAAFERRGFVPQRQVAKHHWVMTKTVEASPLPQGSCPLQP